MSVAMNARSCGAALLPLLTLLVAGCASGEYYDTNAAVDARPECGGIGTERTGEPVPSWCDREQGMSWSSEPDEAAELDFDGRGDD